MDERQGRPVQAAGDVQPGHGRRHPVERRGDRQEDKPGEEGPPPAVPAEAGVGRVRRGEGSESIERFENSFNADKNGIGIAALGPKKAVKDVFESRLFMHCCCYAFSSSVPPCQFSATTTTSSILLCILIVIGGPPPVHDPAHQGGGGEVNGGIGGHDHTDLPHAETNNKHVALPVTDSIFFKREGESSLFDVKETVFDVIDESLKTLVIDNGDTG